jgi:hypothetical protein
MQSRKPSNSPGLGRYSLFHYGCSTLFMERSAFLFLLWPLGELGWSTCPDSFSFFCSLLSRAASSAMAYLLVIANISFDILGFFIASLRIKDESLSPFMKNMIIELLSTSRMMFLLLQKHWINPRRDPPSPRQR